MVKIVMQRVDVSKLCQIKLAEASIEKLASGPRIEYFLNDSKHPILQTLKQMQFGAAVTDIHDAYSVHFAALEEGIVFGGARLVMPNAHLGLPSMSAVIQSIGMNKIEPTKCSEITHFVTKQEARRRHSDVVDGASNSLRHIEGLKLHVLSKNQIFILRLLKTLFDYAKSQGMTFILFSMTESMQHILRTIHFCFENLEKDPSVGLQHGTTVCVFNIPELEKNLIKAGHMVGQWFVRPDSQSPMTAPVVSSFNHASQLLTR